MRIALFVSIFLLSFQIQAQEPLYIDLATCYSSAEQHFALQSQQQLLDEVSNQTMDALGAKWQPQVSLNAQATYQSDVVGLPIESPLFDIPSLSKDQYRATVDVTQMLYDGGLIRQQKDIRAVQTAIEQAKTELNFFALYQQIDQLYCGILLARSSQLLIVTSQKDLENKAAQLRTAFTFGTASENAVRTLEVELLRVQQKLDEAKYKEKASLRMLSILTNIPLDTSAQLLIPSNPELPGIDQIQRPELKVFDQQLRLSDVQYDYATSIQLPRINAFAQGGYGRPGLNLLVNDFDAFYIVGVKLSYPIWSGGVQNHEAETHQLNKELIALQKQNFITSTQTQSEKLLTDIQQLQNTLSGDNAILALQQSILETSGISLENGASTAADYARDANALLQSKLSKQIHETELLYVQLQYIKLLGLK